MKILVPLALSLATITLPAPVTAQDGMELQRCIWSCLSAFPPATNPKYHRCVEQNCNGSGEQSTPASQVKSWKTAKLSPGDPPYLDGIATSAETMDGQIGFSYVCGKNGSSYLSMAGQPIDALQLNSGSSQTINFKVDNSPSHSASFGEYEGALVHQMAHKAELLTELMKGNRVVLSIGAYSGTIALKGSSKALKKAFGYCH